MPKWILGKHFIVIDPVDDEYLTFPRVSASAFSTFLHAWAIIRKKRPLVPVLEGNKLVGPGHAPEDSAKY